MSRNSGNILKTVGVSAVNNNQQKRDQKTMSVIEKGTPETLPGSAFGWWVAAGEVHQENSNVAIVHILF